MKTPLNSNVFFHKLFRTKKYVKFRELEEIRILIESKKNKDRGIFDPDWYRDQNKDVIEHGWDPLYHYLEFGHVENRNPGPAFDTGFYKNTYPDVVSSGANPLLHYIEFGQSEARAPNSQMLGDRIVTSVRHIIVKELTLPRKAKVALLVAHAPAGRMKPHVYPYTMQLKRAGYRVLLIVIADRPLELTEAEESAADGIIVRDNAGYDFGAWSHAFRIYPNLFGAKTLILTNDSIIPTSDAKVFQATMDRVETSSADVVGLTANHEYGWHVQSYFIALKEAALSSWGFHHFIRDVRRIDDKDEVIRYYEIPFAQKMRSSGLEIDVLYRGNFSANPTYFSWKELIESGFPFIKVLLLRKGLSSYIEDGLSLEPGYTKWPKNLIGTLRSHGFDLEVVNAALRFGNLCESLPAYASEELLVDGRTNQQITDDHSLRVAYFGPWNYDNGLGSASREMLCALRHTGIQLNAYPITKPFHIHKLICPAVPTLDFDARPDIAIVHLNPDSWHLLTSEQRELISSAKQRIGYWVWETDQLPIAWQHDIDSVDRIWAPSTYCADVFSASVVVPVDVVPHPVRVSARISPPREQTLSRYGIDPQSKVILYIFDGASYLVRKNPEALVRAFDASGLSRDGWVLALKTKHLYDRAEYGASLASLCKTVYGVLIIEASMSTDEVMNLISAVDIYASSHCSEGFGLTVAEAMAASKIVVATDFGGTRDFLNDGCGYPVLANPWVLDEDHGHYLKGHGWAKVDEAALADALVTAAGNVEMGDRTLGEAARNNIEKLLSYNAVAKTIEKIFDSLVNVDRSSSDELPAAAPLLKIPSAPHIPVDLALGKKPSAFVSSPGFIFVPIGDDLSLEGVDWKQGVDEDWLIFVPKNSFIAPDALEFIKDAVIQRPDVALFYADDVAADEDDLNRVRLKPDFNQALLVSQDYIGAPIIIRRKTLTSVGGLDVACGSAALYDLVFRLVESGGVISRIPRVLLGYEHQRPIALLEDRLAVLSQRNSLFDIEISMSKSTKLLSQRCRFYEVMYPNVTVVIPTRRTLRPNSEITYIEELLSRLSHTNWPMDRLTVLVGDDISYQPNWCHNSWPFSLRRIETIRDVSEAFNYSAKMNALWREVTDDHIVFMNDDAVPETKDWLKALITFAKDPSVGGVGARLMYEDGSIQHAGMFPTLRTIAHAWLRWPADAATYQNWANAQRDWSVVTGAVFATRKSILDQVNGFDERFSLEFNDVDLCLRIRNLGYRIVYNPDALFVHAEKASRRNTLPPGEEVALFLSRWSHWLENDPSSHPGYAKDRLDLVVSPDVDAWYYRK